MFLFILLCTCSAIIDKLLVFHAYYFLCYVLTYFRPVHASSNYIFGAHLLGKPITHLIDRHDRCHRHEIFWKNVLSKLALCNTKKKIFWYLLSDGVTLADITILHWHIYLYSSLMHPNAHFFSSTMILTKEWCVTQRAKIQKIEI